MWLPSQWRRRGKWILITGGVIFSVVVALGLGAISPLGCWLLPPTINERFIRLYNTPDTLFFVAEGNSKCLITTEGILPIWWTAVRIKFASRENFLSGQSEVLRFGIDFQSDTSTNGVIDGTIVVNRKNGIADVNFIFDSSHEFKKYVNGSYQLSKIKPAAQ
jgi:hypothetical protein